MKFDVLLKVPLLPNNTNHHSEKIVTLYKNKKFNS